MRRSLLACLIGLALASCATPLFVDDEPAAPAPHPVAGGAAAAPAGPPLGSDYPLPPRTETGGWREVGPVGAAPVSSAPVVRDLPPAPPPVGADEAVERWAVQVASLQSRDASHETAVGIAERSFPAYVLTYESPEGTWYRVRVGPFRDRGSAEAIAAALEDFGYSTWLVAEP